MRGGAYLRDTTVLCIYIYVYIYVCLVRAYSVYTHPAPFVRDAIFPHGMLMHVDHCCSRDKTSRAERLNSVLRDTAANG